MTKLRTTTIEGTADVGYACERLERRRLLSALLLQTQQFRAGLEPEGVTSADVNDDGKLDLAVANIDTNSVGVMLGEGNGTFAAAREFPVGQAPVKLTSADFNGDGKLDLAVADRESDDVSVLLGKGGG